MDDSVGNKLTTKHNVSVREIGEAFMNMNGPILKEMRPEHVTNPPTMWFLSRTDKGRILKIVYLLVSGEVTIKSAYEPKQPTINYYCNKTKIAEADI